MTEPDSPQDRAPSPPPVLSPDGIKYWSGNSWVQLPGPICEWDGFEWKVKPPNGECHWNGREWSLKPADVESVWFGNEWVTKPVQSESAWNGTQWVVKPEGCESHWDGTNWAIKPEGRDAHWDGRKWSVQPDGRESTWDGGRWVSAPSNGAYLYVWTGSRWSRHLSHRGRRRLRRGVFAGSVTVAVVAAATWGARAWIDYDTARVQRQASASASAASASASAASPNAGFWKWSSDEVVTDILDSSILIYGDRRGNSETYSVQDLLIALPYPDAFCSQTKGYGLAAPERVPDVLNCGGEGTIICFKAPPDAFSNARDSLGRPPGLDVRLVIGNCNVSVPRAKTASDLIQRLEATEWLKPFVVANQQLKL